MAATPPPDQPPPDPETPHPILRPSAAPSTVQFEITPPESSVNLGIASSGPSRHWIQGVGIADIILCLLQIANNSCLILMRWRIVKKEGDCWRAYQRDTGRTVLLEDDASMIYVGIWAHAVILLLYLIDLIFACFLVTAGRAQEPPAKAHRKTDLWFTYNLLLAFMEVLFGATGFVVYSLHLLAEYLIFLVCVLRLVGLIIVGGYVRQLRKVERAPPPPQSATPTTSTKGP